MRILVLFALCLTWITASGCSAIRQEHLKGLAARDVPLMEGAVTEKPFIDSYFANAKVIMDSVTDKPTEEALGWYRQALAQRGWKVTKEEDPQNLLNPFLLAERNGVTRDRFWISFPHSADPGPVEKTVIHIQVDSTGAVEDVEKVVMGIIDCPGYVLDDSLPGLIWYYLWMPVKLML